MTLGNKEDSLKEPPKRAPKLTGNSSLLAKGSLTSVMIPRGPVVASTSSRPWQHPCCAGDCRGLKNRAMESWWLSPWLKRKPRETRKKTTFMLESLWSLR